MKISKFLRLVCLLLIVAFAANGVIIPVTKAYAETVSASNGMSNAKVVNEQAKTESTDNEGYTELKEKRTEFLKYYQLESKKYEAVSFGLPVHYFKDGEYKEIDNSLELVTDKNGKQKYVNKSVRISP